MQQISFTLLTVIGASCLFWIGNYTNSLKLSRLKTQWIYQLITLAAASAISIVAVVLSGGMQISFWGNQNAAAASMQWLGFAPTDNWRTVGLTMALVPAIGTTIVVGIQLLRGTKPNWNFLPKAILLGFPLALMNSLTEELIFRFIPVTLLSGVAASATIAIVSGLAFGIPHYFGSPGKIIGVAMAGFLGWVMASAMIETNGFATSWFIHFVQDIPIIAMMLLTSFSSNQDSQK
ncbi:MAG: hypothetical protein RLZZ330_42 [Actinomycetota bacterium]|jgi:membrane protease YdiL (CAAX protease family)